MTFSSLLKFVFLVPVLLLILMGFSQSVFADAVGWDLGDDTSPATPADDTSPATEISSVNLENPLNNIDSLEELMVALLNIFMILMIPVIVFFIILAGFKYVTAQGNASKLQEANTTILYAVIGAVLILGAVAISEIIKNTVEQF